MKHVKKDFSQPWKKMADHWEMLASPGRPSTDELRLFKKGIDAVFRDKREKKTKRILVMGSTPELRDLAQSYQAEVTLVDINWEMTLALTTLMKTKRPKEIWVRANWLEAPFPENYFDIILGDFTFENLPFAQHDTYFRNIHRWLKSEGRYISRIWLYRKHHQPMSFDELERVCRGKKITPALLSFFWVTAIFFTGPIGKQETRVSDLWRRVAKWQKKNSLSGQTAIKQLLAMHKEFYPSDKIWFEWNDEGFYRFIEKRFQIISEQCDPKVNLPPSYRDVAPIISLRRK